MIQSVDKKNSKAKGSLSEIVKSVIGYLSRHWQ